MTALLIRDLRLKHGQRGEAQEGTRCLTKADTLLGFGYGYLAGLKANGARRKRNWTRLILRLDIDGLGGAGVDWGFCSSPGVWGDFFDLLVGKAGEDFVQMLPVRTRRVMGLT